LAAALKLDREAIGVFTRPQCCSQTVPSEQRQFEPPFSPASRSPCVLLIIDLGDPPTIHSLANHR